MPKQVVAIDIAVKEEWCKGCAFCVEFCPTEVLKMEGTYPAVVNLDVCTGCGLCEVLCPDFAIAVTKEKEEERVLR